MSKPIFKVYDVIFHKGWENLCVATHKDYVAVFVKMRKVRRNGETVTRVFFDNPIIVNNGNDPDPDFKYERMEEWVI